MHNGYHKLMELSINDNARLGNEECILDMRDGLDQRFKDCKGYAIRCPALDFRSTLA